MPKANRKIWEYFLLKSAVFLTLLAPLFAQTINPTDSEPPDALDSTIFRTITGNPADFAQFPDIFFLPINGNPTTDLVARRRWTQLLAALDTCKSLDSLDIRFLRGYSCMMLERWKQAEEEFSYLFSSNYILDDWVTVFLAKSAFGNGDYELAYQTAKLVEKVPGLVYDVSDIRWRALWKAGKPEKAQIELDSLFAKGKIAKYRLWLNRAEIFESIGKHKEAKELLLKALEEMRNATEWKNTASTAAIRLASMSSLSTANKKLLAEVFLELGNYGKAKEFFEKLPEKDAQVKYNIAVCKMKLGKLDEAHKDFKKLLDEKKFDRGTLWWRICQYYREKDKMSEAKAAADSAQVQKPSRSLRTFLAQENIHIAHETADYVLLSSSATTLCELNPTDNIAAIGVLWAALGFLETSLPDSALRLLRRTKKAFTEPDFADEVLYWEARCLEKTGKTDSAQMIYQNIAENGRQNVFVWLARAKTGATLPQPNTYREIAPFILDSAYAQTRRFLIADKCETLIYSPDTMIILRGKRLAKLGLYDLSRSMFLNLESQNIFDNSPLGQLELWKFYYSIGLYSMASQKAAALCATYANPPKEMLRLRFALPYLDAVEKAAARDNIDPCFIYSVMMQESNFDRFARSYSDARGLMQFIPPTGKTVSRWLGMQSFDAEELYDYQLSIALGSKLLAYLLESRPHPAFALAEYNAGDKPVNRWEKICKDPTDFIFCVELFDYRQTRIYAKKIMGYYYTYSALY